MNNNIINALWIGKNLNKTELLTINSFLNQGHVFQLWAYDKIETKLPENCIIKDASEIIPKKQIFSYINKNQFGHGRGSYAGFSDIFRYKLLYEHGGWWTDMDVTCLKPLDFKADYVFRTHHDLPLVGNIMKVPPKSDLMKDCYQEAISKIDKNNTDWHLPIQILTDNVKKHNLEKYIINFTNPDSWNLIRKMISKNQNISESWYAIHWVNEEWRRNKIPKNSFIKNSLFAELLELNSIDFHVAKKRERLKIKFNCSIPGHFINKYLC